MESNLYHISKILHHAAELNKNLTDDADVKAILGIFNDIQEIKRNEESRQIDNMRKLSDLKRLEGIVRGVSYNTLEVVKEVVPAGHNSQKTMREITTAQSMMEVKS